MSRTYAWGFLYALRAAVYIYVVGGKLTPDSDLYAQGRAYWSSPLTALAGGVAGYQGVCVVGIVGAFALGSIVARYSRGILPPTALALSPAGWYGMEPSPDAAGSAAAAATFTKPYRHWYLVLVASIHLEAALVILGTRIVGRFTSVRVGYLAIGMGAVACFGPHLLSVELGFHMQARYFLPGLTIFVVSQSQRQRRSFSSFLQSRLGYS